ncbi:MAG: phenylalanine--tRNA ligase subunit beta [Clostridiales bacterium]|nr:phenylalanine--tRNA ligase subunit beta [Clostridiales bacterium]
MKLPLSWIKDYVDVTEDIQTLCKKMVDIGLEIEEVVYLGENVTNVKVCQIVEITQHPNAERLLCCKVDVGGEIIPIVTNDHHVKVSDKVPVALHNATLATGLHITKGKMRGEESWGMFCGAEELGINADYYPNADIDGVLVLQDSAVVGSDIRAEVGIDDYVLDVGVPANRQDCNSVLGLAREVAVALGKTCREPDVSYTESNVETTSLVKVDVRATDICKGYYMQGVTDVKIEKSPVWLTQRLAKVGLHGINNLVDITNYVLYEIGQPMHAFDYSDISNHEIIVRRANDCEKIIPLDGKEYVLNRDDLVIADKSRSVGLAGIMGGANSGIKSETDCVLFESASFARLNIRRTGRRLGLRSDSSARFEKGIETYTNNLGLSRALHLVEQLGCGKVTRGRISVGEVVGARTVVLDKKRIKNLLGIAIPDEQVVSILNSLNIKTTISQEGAKLITCIVPPYRDDIMRDCDIIEEIIRVYGYDNIKGTLMEKSRITCGGKTAENKRIDEVKNVLIGLRYSECIFYPFAGKALYEKASVAPVDESQYIKVINPIGEELSLMNRSLAPNMLQCIALNLSRGNRSLRLFESGKVYLADKLPLEQLPVEKKCLSVCATEVTFDDFRNDVLQVVRNLTDGKLKLERANSDLLHPGISADIFVNDAIVGHFGKIHPQVAANFDIDVDCMYAELDMDKLMENARGDVKYQSFGKFPSVSRDFAFLCDEDVPAQAVLDEFLNIYMVESAELFDIYRDEKLGAGKKSLAITVVFRDRKKTLQDGDIEKQCSRALKALKDKYGVTLRE